MVVSRYEEDYPRMGWHDCRIRAIAFSSETFECSSTWTIYSNGLVKNSQITSASF
jgi:hypothetical protein